MDFWEGALLGPFWVQTDYADHRHGAFHFFIGISAAIFAISVILFPRLQILLPFPAWFYFLLMTVLLLALPFLAARYHAMPLAIRLMILLAYGLQYCSAWCFPVKLYTHYVDTNSSDVLQGIARLGDLLMNRLADFFSFLGGLAASLTGVIVGAILTTGAFLLFFLLVVYLPLLFFFIVKRIQRLIDYLAMKRFYADRYTL